MAEYEKHIIKQIEEYGEDWREHNGAEAQEFIERKFKGIEESLSDRATLDTTFDPAEDGSKGTLTIKDLKGKVITSCEMPLGGGSASAEGITAIRLEARAGSPTVRLGADVDVSYSYDCIISGGPNSGESTGLMADIEIEVIGASMASLFKRTVRNVAPGTYTVSLGKYLQSGDNSVYVRAAVADPASGETKTRSAYAKVTALDISLSTSFALAPMCADGGYAQGVSVPVPFEVAGAGNKQVMLYVDGILSETRAVTRSGRTSGSFSVRDLAPGLHAIQLVAEVEQDGVTVRSSSHYIDVYVKGPAAAPSAWIAVKAENADGTILPASANAWRTPSLTVKQRGTVSLQFVAYDPASLRSEVQIRSGAVTLQSISADRSLQTLSQRFVEDGNTVISLCVADCIRSVKVTVTPSDIDVSTAQLGLVFSDESGHTLTNGDTLALPATPFADEPRTEGMTLEATLTVGNVIDRGAVIMDCTETLADGSLKGLRMTGDEIAYYTGEKVTYTNEDGLQATRDIKLSTFYSPGDELKVAFVVRPDTDGAGDRLMELYINGDRAGADIYGLTFRFRQPEAAPLTFGSAGADVSLRSVRMWSRALSDDECLDNWLADITDLDLIEALFRDNDVLDATGSEVDISKILAQGKGVLRIVRNGGIDEVFATNDKKKDFLSDVRFTSPFGDAHSFVLHNCNIRIQGTSSTKYPSKNIRIYLTKGSSVELLVGGASVKSWAVRPGATGVTVICLKADYSDSSMTLNTGSAKLFNDLALELGILTPPQQWQRDHGGDITVRTAIDGYPIDVFVSDTEDSPAEYLGQYNLNNEKSKSGRVFGMEGVEGYTPECPVALEFLNNSSKICLFDTVSDEELATLFDKGAEVNYGIDADGKARSDGDCAWHPNPDKEVTELCPEAKAAVTGLWSWLRSCKPAGADPADINTYVSSKFRTEATQHLCIDNLCMYYLLTDCFASVDQRAKNMIARTWDGLVWYLTWYDGDTQMGKRNDSFLKYLYTVTRDTWDGEMSKYAFEGHDSLLWNLMLANFLPELRAMAQRLRDRLSLTRALEMFNVAQAGNWPARLYNKSGEIKYITPAIRETYGQKWPFIYALQGSNTAHRTHFLTNRLALFDARWGVSSAHDDNIDLYLARSAADTPERVRITASEDYIFGYGTNNSPDIYTSPDIIPGGTDTEIAVAEAYTINDPLRIYGASRIRRLDMRAACSHLKNGLGLSKCTAMQELDLSVPAGSSPSESWFMNLAGCRALRRIDLNGQKGARTSSGSSVLDFTGQPRLEYLDLRGVNTSGVVLAKGAPVTRLYLPETITTLVLDGHRDLTSTGLSIPEGVRLESITVRGCPSLDLRPIVEKAIAAGTLRELVLEDIEWANVSLSLVDAFASMECKVTGVITLNTTETVDYATKCRLIAQFGDIDSPAAPLRIIYRSMPLGSKTLKISGPKEMASPGRYSLTLNPSAFNDCLSVTWEMPANSYASIEQDGTVTVIKRGSEDEAPEITVTVRVLMESGEEITATKLICFYERTPQIGDIVYADGSTSNEWDDEKTAVGVYALSFTALDGTIVRLCARKGLGTPYDAWGLDKVSFPDITLNSDPSYNVYRAVKSGGSYAGISVLIEDMVTPWGQILPEGTYVHNSWLRSMEIINHRDKILKDLGIAMPYRPNNTASEYSALQTLMNGIVADNGGQSKYQAFYYPLISGHAHFQPAVRDGETLSPKFMAGKWFAAGVDLTLEFRRLTGTDTFRIGKENGIVNDISSLRFATSQEYIGADDNCYELTTGSPSKTNAEWANTIRFAPVFCHF